MYFKYQNSRHLINLINQSQVFKEYTMSFNKHKLFSSSLDFKRRKKKTGRNTIYLDYLKETQSPNDL